MDIEVGDIVLTGKFRNKRTKVKTIGTDDLGQPTVNGKPILNLRIEKLLPKEKQSKETREELEEKNMSFTKDRFKELAGLLVESSYHFAKHDYQATTISKNISQLVKDLSYDMNWSKEDQEEIYSDLQNMISNYLRQISK